MRDTKWKMRDKRESSDAVAAAQASVENLFYTTAVKPFIFYPILTAVVRLS